jgi:hypothetical protein
MRRHVEDVIILADELPGRGWCEPVPMVDVIRGAVSEIEDYARVTTLAEPDVGLVGRAVGDTMHLLAELIENAASFSPLGAQVQVSGGLVPNGFVIEIEDRGAGMTAEVMAEANRRLGDPTGYDPSTGPRLGLYVVARLARRHGIQVRLRPSAYGGTSAVVLVPPELVAVELGGRATDMALAGRAGAVAPAAELEHTEVTTPAPPGPLLPRRVPQASLAAQLHDPERPSTGEPPVTAPSAERTRARLSAFQKGTALGRQWSPAPDTGAAPDSGGETAAEPGRLGG